MQRACKELKQDLQELKRNILPELHSLVDKYKETGGVNVKEKLEQKLKQADTDRFQKKLLQKTKELFEKLYNSDEFEDKLKIEDGNIVVDGDLEFWNSAIEKVIEFFSSEKDYIPSSVKKVKGSIHLIDLKSANNLKLPEEVEEHLDLQNLESAENLELPVIVGGNISLRRLTSLEGVELPNEVGGDINLQSLKSAENLDLSKYNIEIKGDIYLDSLSQKERDELKEEYPQYEGQITTWD